MQFVRHFCTKLKPIHDEIRQIVTSNKVALFMKGSPQIPQCGFSRAVVQILNMHGVRDYAAVDVLEKEEIRKGIKEYSNWPTIPQLFFNGELIGGCDILLEMHRNGDLIKELDKIGIKSDLAKQK